MCQIYSKLTIKTQRTTSGTSIGKFEHVSHNIAEFEQINAGWPWETAVWENKIVFGNNSEEYIVLWLWAAKIRWNMFSCLFTQYKVGKR